MKRRQQHIKSLKKVKVKKVKNKIISRRYLLLESNIYAYGQKMEGKTEKWKQFALLGDGIIGFCECASVYTINIAFKCIHM